MKNDKNQFIIRTILRYIEFQTFSYMEEVRLDFASAAMFRSFAHAHVKI